MKENQKLKTSNGTEVLLYPMSYGYISQGTHNYNGINYNAYDLGGKENASGAHEAVFAPCSMTIAYNQMALTQYTNTIIFISDNPVLLADGTISRVAILMAHCDNIREFVSKETFAQGELCYYEGTYDNGIGKRDAHLHIEVTKVGSDGKYQTLSSPFSLVNSLPLEKVFYSNGTDVTGGANVGNLNSYGFKTYSSTPFNPSGKPNGWNEYNGEWYYVENSAIKKGWIQLNKAWFYLDYTTGAMKTGWAADGAEWYYMNPENGHMVTGWLWDEGYQGWYFLNPNNGGAMQTYWLTDGGKKYYLGSDGKMYKDCRERINGVWYTFDNSGVATQG